MDVIVPFDAIEPKSRLSPRLSTDERTALAEAMARDVLGAIRDTGHQPTVLSTASVDFDAPTRVDDRPLTEAVNAVLSSSEESVAVVMADLALATPEALQRVFDAPGDVVLVPGRGGGTNVVLARDPSFRVDYHGVSIRDHREAAAGLDVTEVDSARLSTDIDEPTDLVEVLLHTDGEAAALLQEWGFAVVSRGGRVGVERDPEESANETR